MNIYLRMQADGTMSLLYKLYISSIRKYNVTDSMQLEQGFEKFRKKIKKVQDLAFEEK